MDKFQIDHDEAEEIVNWAISAGAMLHLMVVAPRSGTAEERYEANEQAIQVILENMPVAMVDAVLEWADEIYEDASKTEDEVQEFVQELDKVKPEDFDIDGN